MSTQACEIPIPPTANHLWSIFGNRMHRTSNYRKWLEHTSDLLRESLHPVKGPVHVSIQIYGGKGWSKARDLDNIIKPVLDVLRPPSLTRDGTKITKPGAAIITDDTTEFVRAVTALYVVPEKRNKAEAWCQVTIKEEDHAVHEG